VNAAELSTLLTEVDGNLTLPPPLVIGYRIGMTDPDHWLQIEAHIDGEWQHGRKWRLSLHMTRSEIVQTIFAAALAFQEHELREGFRYKGQAIFSPHYDIDALWGVKAAGNMDVRVPA
jgi:hypothetical protein